MSRRGQSSDGMEDMEFFDESDREVVIDGQPILLSVIDQAIRRGQVAADFCTASHPITARGSVAWFDTNASFRGSMAGTGWKLSDDFNIPCVTSPDGTVTITCVSGNSKTGLRENGAAPRRPRGEAGIRVIRRNKTQIELVELLPEGEQGDEIEVAPKTWYLLFYRAGDVVRNELSLAQAVSGNGSLIKWAERKILPEINLLDDGEGGSGGPGSGNRNVPSVDVPVERLAS